MSKGTSSALTVVLVVVAVGGLAVGGYFLLRRRGWTGAGSSGGGGASGPAPGTALFNAAGAAADYLRGGDGSGHTSQGGSATDLGSSRQGGK